MTTNVEIYLGGTMSHINLDWQNLGFEYHETPYRYVANYQDQHWCEGEMTTSNAIPLNESAAVLQYCQTIFEGLKAYRTQDGRVVTFRPDLNAQRMIDSALRLEMPAISKDQFLEAISEVITHNIDYIPPYGSGASLYIRPYMFATTPLIGVKPANDYQFRVFASPVGPYFTGGVRALTLCVAESDRSAPRGTGHIKAGLNYAMSLHALMDAKHRGYDENMYLDSATRTYVEETGGANFIFVTKDGTVVTPKSTTILPSITRRSLLEVAVRYFGMKVEERPVAWSELSEYAECGLCGTAAVLSPVGKIVRAQVSDPHTGVLVREEEVVQFPSGMEGRGPVTQKLYETLVGIQYGEIEAPEGWIYELAQ